MRRMFGWGSFGLVTVGLGALATACALECTMAGCYDQVAATFETRLTVAGEYELRVQTSAGDTSCTFEVPSGAAGGAGGDATGSVDETNMQCVTELPAVYAYLDDSGRLMFELVFDSETEVFPSEMTVELSHEGAVVAGGTYELEYTEIHPNGEQCGPECHVAEVLIE